MPKHIDRPFPKGESYKDVENRTWTTDYRGELLIHSSGKIDMYDFGFNEYQTLPLLYLICIAIAD